MARRTSSHFLLVIVILCGGLAAQTGQFMEAPQYAVGISPLAAAAGDLNGDGKLDLVVTNKVDETISVLINNGDGTFKPQAVVDVGDVPAAVALADLNGDGYLDVVVVLPVLNESPGSHVSVLLGRGDGTFQHYVLYNTASAMAPQFVAVGDLNGDGKPDLVVTNTGPDLIPGSTISVLINNGSGGFPTHVDYVTGYAPLAVTIADLNGDGKMDLAVANGCGSDPTCALSSAGTVSVLLGNGNGTFQNQTAFQVGYRPDAIVAADFNGDNKMDLAIGNFNGNNVSILIGQGNGSFNAQVQYPTAVWEPYGIVAADFNRDGKMDLAVSTSGSTAVSILLGKGDGTFQTHQDYWAGNGAGIPAAGDFNGDTFVDLAIPDLGWANRPDVTTTILMGNGDGTFRSHVLYETSVTPGALATADFNEDGKLDLVVGWDPTATDPSNGRIDVLLSNANGTYDPYVSYATGNLPASVAVGDFNRDGHMDIAVANYGTATTPDNTVSVLLGNGDGTFQPQVLYPVGNSPLAITAADVNGDGNLDLIVSNTGDSTPTVGVLLGNGDGSFQGQKTSNLGGIATAMAVADLNGDGRPDLVAVLSKANRVATLLGNGDGTYKAPVQFATGTAPVSVAVGDLNGDGKIDVAVVNNADANVGVLMGNGDGTLGPQVTYTTPSTPTSVVLGNFNGDAKLDLLVSSQYANNASLFLGNGDGTFATPVAYGTGWQPLTLIAADLNLDGTLDVVSANAGVRSVSLIMNAGGTFINIVSLPPNPTYGENVNLTASIAPSISWNPKAPSGTISFLDGKNLLGTRTLSGGAASFTTSSLPAGQHNLAAAYSGDATFQPHTSSSILQSVSIATSTTSLASSTATSGLGQPVAFTATVLPEISGSPSGTVVFFDGATQIGTGILASGVAAFTTSSLTVATHNIHATYAGDSNFSGSTSPDVAVNVVVSDFAVVASAFAGPIKAGESATSTITVTPANGFNAAVTFSCSAGLPSKSACAFNPATVTPTSNGVTSVLTITTTAATAALRSGFRQKAAPLYALLLPISLVMMFGVGFGSIRSRQRLGLLLSGLLVLSLTFMLACGGGSGSSTTQPVQPVTPGTPAGTYTITVTAVSGSGSSSISKTTTVSLTVQ